MTLYGVELIVADDLEEAASILADTLVEAARAGRSIALTGGHSPGRAYELAAEREPDWSKSSVWWGDERCVPPDDERSNYLLARETLLDRLEAQPAETHRIRGELGAAEAAEEYDRLLEGVSLGLVLLGHRAGRPHRVPVSERARARGARAPGRSCGGEARAVRRPRHDDGAGARLGARDGLHRHGRGQGGRRRTSVRTTAGPGDSREPDPVKCRNHAGCGRSRRRREVARLDNARRPRKYGQHRCQRLSPERCWTCSHSSGPSS